TRRASSAGRTRGGRLPRWSAARSTAPRGRPPARSPAPRLRRTAASPAACSPRTDPAPPAPRAAPPPAGPGARSRKAIACGASSESELEGEDLVVPQGVSQSGVGVVDRDATVAHRQAHAEAGGQPIREAPVRTRLVTELLADAGEEHAAVRVLRAERRLHERRGRVLDGAQHRQAVLAARGDDRVRVAVQL